MAQAITPDLTTLLKSKLQAGAQGFRGELEVDYVAAAATVTTQPIYSTPAWRTWRESYSGGAIDGTPSGWADVAFDASAWDVAHDLGAYYLPAPAHGLTPPQAFAGSQLTALHWLARGPVFTLDAVPATATIDFKHDDAIEFYVNGVLVYSNGADGTGLGISIDPSAFVVGDNVLSARVININLAPNTWATNPTALSVSLTLVTDEPVGIETLTLPVASLDIDRSRAMAAAQLDARLSNEASEVGFYTALDPFLVPNNPVRAFAWYGDRANRVQVFAGLLDRVHESRDPRSITVKARSRMKWLLEQLFETSASQTATDDDAVRTEDNGVYLGRSPEYIAGDILDRAGWPAADRDIAVSGMVISEYDLADKTSWVEQIAGSNRLTTITGWDLWEDELGVIHFKANRLADTSEPTPDYTLEAGVDVLQLDHEVDDEDRATRVRVTGPMTSAVPAWAEEWSTTALLHPVGTLYRPSESGYLYVIDRLTQNLYKLRQSDRAIVAHWYLGGSLTNQPIGLSGDPSDGAHFYVLDAHLPGSGVYTNCKVRKYAFSAPATLVSTTTLPDGQWSDFKFDGSHLWLTNFGDDKLYKKTFNAGGAAGATANYTYAGHTNPTGLYLDGTTIGLFFNGGAAFYLVDTSAPGTIVSTQSTAGTRILGGEADTTTHADLYATNEAGDFGATAGHVWKFQLTEEVTSDVTELAADQELEDSLGFQSGIADRVHDLHPEDDAHPFEMRLAVYSMLVVTSTTQALEVAEAQLALLSRLRRVLDLATLGEPQLQVDDVIRYVDPVAGIDSMWVLDSYRAQLDANTYTTSMSLLPWEAPA